MRWLNYILPLSTLTVLPLILVVKEPNREGSWRWSLLLQQMNMTFNSVPNHIENWLQKLKQDHTFSYTLSEFAFENAMIELALKACYCESLMSTTWIKSDTWLYEMLCFDISTPRKVLWESIKFHVPGWLYCKRKSDVWLHLRQLLPLIQSLQVPTVFCSDQPETSAFIKYM